jgi:hypothetical protein
MIAPLECIKEGWALIKDRYWLFFGITLVGVLIGSAVPIVLLGPMMVGIFLCLFDKQRGRPVEFGTLFKGFDYFLPSLIVTVLKVIPIIILMVPFYLIMFAVMMTRMPRGEPNPAEMPAFMFTFFAVEIVFVLILMVVGIAIELFFMFALPLVADRKLAGIDAVKLSFKACKANIGGVLGLLLLNTVFGIVGVLCCFVGVYFYLPVAFASYAVAYRRVFPEVPETFISPPPPPPPGSWAA